VKTSYLKDNDGKVLKDDEQSLLNQDMEKDLNELKVGAKWATLSNVSRILLMICSGKQ